MRSISTATMLKSKSLSASHRRNKVSKKKHVLVTIDEEIEIALRRLDPEKKMSLSRALEHIYYAMMKIVICKPEEK